MDIANVVVYEHIHELRVTFPNSDRYLGLTIGVRNASSEAAKAAMRKQENDRQKTSRNKQKKMSAEVQEQNELELTASTIAWWRWEKSGPSDKAKAAMTALRNKMLAHNADIAKKREEAANRTEEEKREQGEIFIGEPHSVSEIEAAVLELDDGEMARYNGEQPKFSMDVAIEILDKVSFIYAQVKGASIDVENFMKIGSDD